MLSSSMFSVSSLLFPFPLTSVFLMIMPSGFVAGAPAELFGSGSILNQLSNAPQVVLLLLALITVGTITPIAKGTQGDYLTSLQDTYA